ncbi:MAG: ABC transporter ATP-binding protein [Actinobacteria bacterium]|nr:ABC transporter ATP-binding protein [Actinomycetota bacterium]
MPEPNGAVESYASEAREMPGSVVMEAIGLCKDFRLGHGQLISAVRGVSLNLYRGGVVALVGESGSGKSTVAKLLAGQERPSAGTVLLEGEPVVVSNRRSFRLYKSEVQYVFQDPFSSLNPVHTVRHHLERPLRLHMRAPKSELEARLLELMNQVRLTPAEQFLPMYPHELSGGQRQRVSFARALAAGPKVLLADEPVSMLDVSIRLEMLNLLDDLRRRFQLALLYITHDIASARYFADEALVMYAGQIVERGPAEELTQSPAHPYTQLLVASAPDPEDLGGLLRRGPNLAGRGQAAAASPATVGCSFSSRCPLADERCRSKTPKLVNVGESRAAACWHLDVAAPALASRSKGVMSRPDRVT